MLRGRRFDNRAPKTLHTHFRMRGSFNFYLIMNKIDQKVKPYCFRNIQNYEFIGGV